MRDKLRGVYGVMEWWRKTHGVLEYWSHEVKEGIKHEMLMKRLLILAPVK